MYVLSICVLKFTLQNTFHKTPRKLCDQVLCSEQKCIAETINNLKQRKIHQEKMVHPSIPALINMSFSSLHSRGKICYYLCSFIYCLKIRIYLKSTSTAERGCISFCHAERSDKAAESLRVADLYCTRIQIV